LLPLAGRAGQFHATRVDSQCFGGALPPFCASAAWQRSCWAGEEQPSSPARPRPAAQSFDTVIDASHVRPAAEPGNHAAAPAAPGAAKSIQCEQPQQILRPPELHWAPSRARKGLAARQLHRWRPRMRCRCRRRVRCRDLVPLFRSDQSRRLSCATLYHRL